MIFLDYLTKMIVVFCQIGLGSQIWHKVGHQGSLNRLLRINVLWVFFAATARLIIIKLDTSKATEGSFIEIKS